MQNYYDVEFFGNTVPNAQFQLSFVGTLLEVCVNLMGPVAQLIASRFGTRVVLIIGTILATLGLELAGFSTQVWEYKKKKGSYWVLTLKSRSGIFI